jgi:5'-nucleotidase
VSHPPILTVAVSSRALFHIEDGHEVFETQGQRAFDAYMRERADVPMLPGVAFPLVRKLLSLNTTRGLAGRDRVNVVLLSRNSPDAGLRIMNSVAHHGLDIESAVFGANTGRFRYAKALGAHLFLSANGADVVRSIESGVAAATLIPKESLTTGVDADDIVRIAFDGDSVLFSSEADDYFRRHGLAAFMKSESESGDVPLAPGPLAGLLHALSRLQAAPDVGGRVKLALVTARSLPAHARPLNTIHGWGLRLDEAFFAGGLPKGPFVKAFGADAYFDDVRKHIDDAGSHDVLAGHVPFGGGQGIGAEQLAHAAAAQ